ncbi:MAG: hypothetical protein K5795_07455 [Lachnospiraceae bacterium]|nr:hypothetical protein [Lachnospiraceae bacterium]
MQFVALVTCVLIGWVEKVSFVELEVLESAKKFKSKKLVSVMLRFVCIVCLVIIIVTPFVTDI